MPQEGSQSSFVENLMMSTAEIQYYDNGEKTPYSPRLQGAGLLNLKAASETPVILTGDPDGMAERRSSASENWAN